MNHFKPKGALLVALSILVLFSAMELYGVLILHDASVVFPTLLVQVVAITVIVTPMMYGILFDSSAEGEEP